MQIQTDIQHRPIEEIITSALEQLEARGFGKRTIRYYRHGWIQFSKFAATSTPPNTRIRELGIGFLAECGIAPDSNRRDLSWSQDVIRRGMRILVEIQETNRFHCHVGKTASPCLPILLRQQYERYQAFCTHHLRHRATTIASHQHALQGFLMFLTEQGITTLAELQPAMLNAFITARAQSISVRSLATEIGCVRSFLRFLCMEGIVAADLVAHARTLRFSKEHRLPPVWPSDAVEALLRSVDRTSGLGKRNFAILLLAARLGLRACDIRALKLENIRWGEDRLTLIQSKTGRSLVLPLGEEIGQSLVEYIRHARPRSQHRHVFLKARAPHDPFGSTNPLYSIVTSTTHRAGITLPPGMPKGLHSLRHTLATALVTAGKPLESVAAVLGHGSIESTRIYTHLDRCALSSVALDPEEVLHG